MGRTRRYRTISMTLLTLGLGLAAVAHGAPPASAADSVAPLPDIPHTPLYDVGVPKTVSAAQVAAASTTASTVLPHYSATIRNGTRTFTYSIVGKNPAVVSATPLSTVSTLLVPLVIKFSNGKSWDPTKADSCDSGATPLARTVQSPIFVSQAWTWGGTSIGTGQVTDAFQRAEFWKYAKPTGVDPGYGVQLAHTTVPKVVVNVPAADGAQGTGVPCGNGLLGAVNIDWLDSYLQGTVIPALAAQGLTTAKFPLFLVHNVVEYIGSTSNCCVLGYHSAFSPSAGAVQTYGIATYDNTTLFSGVADVSTLTHEVGEWVNDPYGTNPTAAWGNIGQVTGCQSNLEVGDPLSGTTYADTVGSFTYHLQELAFFSWFYRQVPSIGVNGWYSNGGTFRSPAAACP